MLTLSKNAAYGFLEAFGPLIMYMHGLSVPWSCLVVELLLVEENCSLCLTIPAARLRCLQM